MVYEAAKAVDIPVIGIGGINSLEDVIEFLIAGASAVQVGTMNFVNPAASGELLHGLQRYLEEENITLNELIGSIELPNT